MKSLFTRDFTLLILGQVSSLIGNYTLRFALSMYVLEVTGSAAVFAALLAAAMAPTILLSPFGGVLADRGDRRRLMTALDALSGLAVLLAGLALPAGGIPVVGGLLIVLSVLGAFESPTVQACVPQLLPPEQLIRGNALVSQTAALAALVTPFLGSLVYTAFGLLPVLRGTAVCFFLTALLECLLRLPGRAPSAPQPVMALLKADLLESARFLSREEPAILKLLLLAGLASLFVAGVAVVGFPYLVRTVLGLSAEHYGAAESAMGGAAILGSLTVGVLGRRFRTRWLTGVLVGFGACLLPAELAFLLPLGLLQRYLVLVAAFSACQLGCSLFSTCAITLIQTRTPERLMGKVMSLVFTLSLCAQPLGQLVYGGLFDSFAAAPHWVLLPTGLLICAVGAASAPLFAALEQP